MAESDVVTNPTTTSQPVEVARSRNRSTEGWVRQFGAIVHGEALPRPRAGSSTEEILADLSMNTSGDHCGGTK